MHTQHHAAPFFACSGFSLRNVFFIDSSRFCSMLRTLRARSPSRIANMGPYFSPKLCKYPIYSINCYSIRPWMMECDATPNVPGIAIFTLTKKNDKKRSFFQKTETWDQSKVETCDSQCNGLQAQSKVRKISEVPLTRPAARGLRVAF